MNATTLEVQPEVDAVSALPEGWTLSTIGLACELNPPKPAKNALPPEAPVTFVPMPAVDAELGAITTPGVRPFSKVRGGYTAFRDGDVIMAKITPCMENGKAAIVRDMTNGLGFGSTEFHVLRPNGAALAEYLYYHIRREAFRSAAEAEMTGSVGQRRVPAEFLSNAPIPLPPLTEQRLIVAQVEALLARVSAARERLAAVPTIMQRFRQAVLAAACSGRLTDDWPRSQPEAEANDELLRWLQRRTAVRGRDRTVAPRLADELDIPRGWLACDLADLATSITSGSRAWTKYYGSGEGTFIMAQNVRPGFLDLRYRQAVNPPPNDPEKSRTKVELGDILVTIVGANTGDACAVAEQLSEHYVCQSVALVRPVSADLAPFLNLYLNSTAHGRVQFDRFIYGEGRPHLSFRQLKSTRVVLPPLAEQAEIVRRAQSLFALADAVGKRVRAATLRAEKLTEVVLAKAFSGDLVPTEAELARQERGEAAQAHILETAPALSKRSR